MKKRSLKKTILIGIAAVFGLLLVAVLVGAGWFIHAVRGHLVPPPDSAGQPSIATYARPDPATPAAAPVLVKDFSWDTIAQPPRSARPWTRWWWPGGDIDAATLVKQVELLDTAGFAGGEVQPFLSGATAIKDKAVMDRVYSFDTPSYYEKLRALLTAAAARDWQIDLSHFSGWPPGGPEINLDDSLTEIVYGETEVSGGRSVDVALPKPKGGPLCP